MMSCPGRCSEKRRITRWLFPAVTPAQGCQTAEPGSSGRITGGRPSGWMLNGTPMAAMRSEKSGDIRVGPSSSGVERPAATAERAPVPPVAVEHQRLVGLAYHTPAVTSTIPNALFKTCLSRQLHAVHCVSASLPAGCSMTEQGRSRAQHRSGEKQSWPQFQPGHPGTGRGRNPTSRSPPPATTAPPADARARREFEQVDETSGKRDGDGRFVGRRHGVTRIVASMPARKSPKPSSCRTPPEAPASPCAKRGTRMTTRSRRLDEHAKHDRHKNEGGFRLNSSRQCHRRGADGQPAGYQELVRMPAPRQKTKPQFLT